MRKFVLVLLIVVITFLALVSCKSLVKMTYNENGLLTDGNNEYKYAPTGYEPTNQGDEYAIIKGSMEEKLYKIGTLDTADWLTTEYSGNATLVYYNVNINLPSLAELKPSLCYLCEQDTNSYSIYTIGENDGESSVIDSLVRSLSEEDSESPIWPRTDSTETYHLKFYSDNYKAIYYDVSVAKCPDGTYLFDKVTQKCVFIADLLDPFIENTYE